MNVPHGKALAVAVVLIAGAIGFAALQGDLFTILPPLNLCSGESFPKVLHAQCGRIGGDSFGFDIDFCTPTDADVFLDAKSVRWSVTKINGSFSERLNGMSGAAVLERTQPTTVHATMARLGGGDNSNRCSLVFSEEPRFSGQPVPDEPVPEPAPQPTLTCPDGSMTTDLELCPDPPQEEPPAPGVEHAGIALLLIAIIAGLSLALWRVRK